MRPTRRGHCTFSALRAVLYNAAPGDPSLVTRKTRRQGGARATSECPPTRPQPEINANREEGRSPQRGEAPDGKTELPYYWKRPRSPPTSGRRPEGSPIERTEGRIAGWDGREANAIFYPHDTVTDDCTAHCARHILQLLPMSCTMSSRNLY